MARVAYFLDQFPARSETFILDELEALSQRGCAVFVFARWSAADANPSELARVWASRVWYGEREALPGVRRLMSHMRWAIRHPRRYWMMLALARRYKQDGLGRAFRECAQYADAIRAAGATWVHAHFAAEACDTALLVSGLTGVPFSFTVHAHDLYATPRLLPLKLHRAARVVAISVANRDALSTLAPGLAPDRIVVVHCGLDLAAWPLQRHACPSGALRLLSVGRLVEKKGFDVLIEACARVIARGVPVECTIIGQGPMETLLRARIDALGMGRHVRLAGAASREAVKDALAACDAFVLPCRVGADGDRDGIPVSLMEAMATGRPVISTRLSGIPELVRDGAGRLVEPGDVEALAMAMEALARASSEERQAMGRGGRRIVEEAFQVDRQAERLAPLFGQALSSAPVPPRRPVASEPPLTVQAARGLSWSLTSILVNRGMRFLVTMVLARLLVPEYFGLIGMAGMVIDIVSLVNDLGLGAALIQRKELTEADRSTCFWVNSLLGAGLWGLTYAVAPWVALFFRNPMVTPIVRVMGLTFLIGPWGSVQYLLFTRELRFKRMMIAQTAATVGRGVVALGLAVTGFGVWSIVWGQLASTMIGIIANWMLHPWRPRLLIDRGSFRTLFHFGRNVFGERIVSYFRANSDYLVTGRLLGASSLGYYTLAYELPYLALTYVSQNVARVLLPVLCRVQDDLERVRRGYLATISYIALVTFPALAGLTMVAPEFVVTIYGAKWAPMIRPLQMLCASALVSSIVTTTGTVQHAAGRPDVGFQWNCFAFPVTLGVVAIGARWGILGVAAAMALVSVILGFCIQLLTNRLIALPPGRFFLALAPAAESSAVMAAGVALARVLLRRAGLPPGIILAGSVATGLCLYAAMVWWRHRPLIVRAVELWRGRPEIPPAAEAAVEPAAKAAESRMI